VDRRNGCGDDARLDRRSSYAAVKYSNSVPQFALRLTLNNPVVGTALVGIRTPANVIGNLGALGWGISNADMTETDVIFDRHGAITLPPGWLED
jgi:aryl-alcohol dehydrogenase-like predicted oxidoreductase